MTIRESKIKDISNFTTDNIILMDPDFRVIYFNETLRKNILADHHKNIGEGDDYRNFVAESEKDFFLESFSKVLKGESVEKDLEVNSIWFRYEFHPFFDERPNGSNVLLKFRNIDTCKRQEISFVQSEEVMKELIRKNLEMEQFVYTVSHNIRAPISTMLGLTSIVENSSNERDKSFAITGLRKSIENLDNVIKDLNEVLQVRKDSSEIKNVVNFNEVLQAVEETLKGKIENNNAKISFDFEAADSILSIRSFIYSIFLNLISNGIKYHQEGVSPNINIRTEKMKDEIILFIKDNGRGIDMDKYGKQIFGLYKRFSLDVEGKGLGLFLVKNQVEAMKGSISVESEFGKGTQFKIILPDIRN